MSLEDAGSFVSRQLWGLVGDEVQGDVAVYFGPSAEPVRMSGIVLSVLSPVWQAKLCRGLSEAARSRLDLTRDDAASFATAVELGCGRSTAVRGGLAGLLSVGRLADAYGIEHVHRAVEWEATRRLTVDTCAELLSGSSVAGMPRLTRTCRELALGEFEALSRTEGFALLEEEELGALLDADMLAEGREDAVLSAVLRWMRPAGAGEARGKSLLTMPAFKRLCKAGQTRSATGTMGEDVPMVDGLHELLGEAAAATEGGPAGMTGADGAAGPLDPAGQEAAGTPGGATDKALEPLLSPITTAARRRWYAHAGTPRAVTKGDRCFCEGRCFAVSRELAACGAACEQIDAVLRHDLSDLAVEMPECPTTSNVTSVAAWRDWIVVGHHSGEIEIWETQYCKADSGQLTNGSSGSKLGARRLQCIGTLDDGGAGHGDCSVTGLGVSGGVSSRLVSESGGVLKVWAAGSTARTWACERTVKVEYHHCLLAVWGASAATGDYKTRIQVWDLDSGVCKTTLPRHGDLVWSAAVHADGRLLVSVSKDRTLRVWDLDTEMCLRKLVDVDVRSVAVSEGKIFGGLASVVKRGAVQTPALRVWDLDTLEQEGTLWVQDMAVGSKVEVNRIFVDRNEVWAHYSGAILVWGWTDRTTTRTMAQALDLDESGCQGSICEAGGCQQDTGVGTEPDRKRQRVQQKVESGHS